MSSSSSGSFDPSPACAGPATVVHEPDLVAYDFGLGHPMSPIRVELTMALAEQLGVLDDDRPGALRVVPAPTADDALVETVHDPAFVAACRRQSEDPGLDGEAFGLGTEDNPAFRGMHDAAAHVVGATVEACRQVWAGESLHSANITGGLHHAMPGRASGFCVYNDVAVGIRWLLDQGAERVAYVDVDAHHGDGVERTFWDDPRVLTISLHESGHYLFPGTGHAVDVGGPGAEGSAVNVALPPGTSDAGWLRAFHAVVPPLLAEFAPQVLLTQHGCDSHAADPLADLMLSVDAQRAAAIALHDLAHEVAGGRWVATGGGGYAVGQVVPRAWSHLLAVVGGAPLAPGTALPQTWRDRVAEMLEIDVPRTMSDREDPGHDPEDSDGDRDGVGPPTPAYRPWEQGYDPESLLDAAIHATRMAAFPLHGLDPQP